MKTKKKLNKKNKAMKDMKKELQFLGIKIKPKIKDKDITINELLENPEKYCYKNDVEKIKTISQLINEVISSKTEKIKIVNSSTDAFYILRNFYISKKLNKEREHMIALLLSNANKVVKIELLSMGGWTATNIDVRVLFKSALEVCASKIILCHNHPSVVDTIPLKPSPQDLDITKFVYRAGKFLFIELLDHIILSGNFTNFYSFVDAGDMEEIKRSF